jgi:hypothetical protein
MNPKTIDHVCSRSVHAFHWRNVGTSPFNRLKDAHRL